ncbi:hypothetical protein ISN45_Aa06g035790 [Arabidopsis thaliana x Arabidopsis arenosa]|uniref:DUF382 domain-containing protein n=1 Tax=Arabidopsis thaliana x Arabidopsis arenosa TaxID=1240361 RepID=A0A8T1Z574_9BRAS|nr:hypothetical protein ISN45_Aa06g035790 [Arabidopsis thaliana x Arabidopsis arenosa]
MTVETVDNGVAPNGDTFSNTNVTVSSKKNKKGSEVDVEEGNVSGDSDSKENLRRTMNIAELKQVSARPDVVEVWDATSADPKLLVFLKSYRNTVPVPRHWSQNRKYLQGNICDNHEAWTWEAGLTLRKSENVAPGTVLGTTHTYVIKTGTQEKTGAKRVDLLRGKKTDQVEVSLQPEELEVMDNVLPAKYEETREEEKLRNKPESFSDMVVENDLKRRRKTHNKEGKKKKRLQILSF